MTPHILLPFGDDSTLFFAQAMQKLLAPLDCTIQLVQLVDAHSLSSRQLEGIETKPFCSMTLTDLATPGALTGIDAIVTSRVYPSLQALLGHSDPAALSQPSIPSSERPIVISFQGGLNFSPERAFAHRRAADVVFLVPKADIERYRAYRDHIGAPPQCVDFGHPFFLMPENRPARLGLRDIYFFAQAISPVSPRGRRHVIDLLAALARRYPDRKVWIKLRHLPGENRDHLHRERYPYPDLLAQLTDSPPNLQVTHCSMAEATERAALGITCTSTAAVDLLRAGVPTQIYLDYVENYLDPLVAPMRRLFNKSGLIASLAEILAGKTRQPDPTWLTTMFCQTDLGQRVLEHISVLQAART